MSRRSGRRSARYSSSANTASRIAICHGWPRSSSIRLSNSAPTTAAGIVAITINQPSRSSVVSTVRRRGAAHHSERVRAQIVAEVRQHGDERAGVQRDVEGLVELGVLLEIVEVEHPGHQDQVPGRGNRQELGQPLHDAQQQRLELVHEPVSLYLASDLEGAAERESSTGWRTTRYERQAASAPRMGADRRPSGEAVSAPAMGAGAVSAGWWTACVAIPPMTDIAASHSPLGADR